MPRKSSGTVKIFYPEYSRTELLQRIARRLDGLARLLPIRRVILFGSWAQDKATLSSDVDLLVIYRDPPREDAYKIVWKILNVRRLEPHVYSEREARGLGPTLVRMTRNGLEIYPSWRSRAEIGQPRLYRL